MAIDLDALEDWAAPLLQQLDSRGRRRIARRIATELRRSQRERIRRQENPDGSRYEPRKRLRDQSGRIRRGPMFAKLRTARYLRTRVSADAASVGFFGRVARIAIVHQRGLEARVDRDGPRYDYPERVLIGYTDADRELIRDILIDELGHV